MKKIYYVYYLKFLLGMLLVTPLEYAFWKLTFSTVYSLLIVTGLNLILFILGCLILNYLENGNCFKMIKI